ncbi:MAG: SBBP repeat-containing protein [Candidatus Schekmanbacteria bacterium]|nr:SBBP repeat-containing protein [Candidatus Schekmanbacteria bacterium]
MTKLRLSSSILFLLILLAPCFAFANTAPDTSKIMSKAAKLQIPFIENQGQIQDKSVKFYANTFAGNVYVTDKGEIVYGLSNKEDSTSLRETLIGSAPSAIKGESKSVTNVNYFVGNKDNWKSNISTFESVSLGEVYEGVELKLKAYGKNVEKLFYVNECGDVEDIKLKVEGAEDISVNKDGELEIETELGTIKFTKPFAYQEIDGKKIEVKCDFVIDFSSYSFRVASYDKNYPLVIDPLIASTYIWEVGEDYSYDIALDSTGNVFITGHTVGNFPTTAGAYSPTRIDIHNAFVSKLDNTLSTLLASTYLGGSISETAYSIAIDPSGNVYVAGTTGSSNFPITAGAYDSLMNSSDVFISKFNNNLSSLLASTFLGGSTYEGAYDLELDPTGNIYVTGYTNSSDFPTTTGAYDISHNGGYDVFISKLNSTLSTLMGSTFLGGVNSDYVKKMALDSSGNVFVTGYTRSSDFSITTDAYDTSYNGGEDVFISKLDNTLTSLLASTFIGGTYNDYGRAIAIDSSDNVFVTGEPSTGFPTIAGSYDTSPNGGYDVFVIKMNNQLNTLVASTFIGGNNNDYGYGIAVDSWGSVYVTGETSSSIYPVGSAIPFPTTEGAFDTSHNLQRDVFVSKLDNMLTSLNASTFLGGEHSEYGRAIVLDSSGNVYVTGETDSNGSSGSHVFPTTEGAYNTTPEYYVTFFIFISKLDHYLTAGKGIPTAITLSSFTADLKNKKVLLTWQTATEIDNLGFNVLRSESESGPYTKINKKLIKSKGSSTKGASYKLKDKNIEAGKTYWYKLEDIDSNTGPAQHDAVKVEVTAKKVKAKK